MNGVAAGGTGVTVDGTEANSNPEARSLAQYGGQNQISVMSLDSVAEVQIVKGVLPAEYGGVAGGQINVISRSGTNVFHGSAFYAARTRGWNARQFFSTAQQPVGTFNQYGGTLGGPVLKNRAFFFTTYEGYREKVERNLDVVVPYQAVRDEINCVRCRFPRPRPCSTRCRCRPKRSSPAASSTRRSAAGAASASAGAPKTTSWPRATCRCSTARNLGLTYTRLRPFTLEPRPNPNNINDREFPNEQDRVAAQLVMTRGAWVSESRFGWNKTYLARLDAFLGVMGPNQPAEVMPYGRRMPAFAVTGLFATPRSEIWDMKGSDLQLRAEIQPRLPAASRQDRLPLPAGKGRPPQSGEPVVHLPELRRSAREHSDVVEHVVRRASARLEHGFVQLLRAGRLAARQPVRAERRSALRLSRSRQGVSDDGCAGRDRELRDVHGHQQARLRAACAIRCEPYKSDGNNFGPRVGFAWTLNDDESTVVRGGVGYLHSPHLIATVRQGAANPFVPFRIVYNRTESTAKNVTWPMYTDDALKIALADAGGQTDVLLDFSIPRSRRRTRFSRW